MKKTLLLFVVSLTMFGCKKSGETPNTANNSYQPVSKGSFWKYKESGFNGTRVSTATMTGKQIIVQGRVYHECNTVYDGLNGVSTGYMHSENGVVMSANAWAEPDVFLFLKENAALGETWFFIQKPGNSYTEPFIVIAEMVEKGITRVVAGRTFTNVIHTRHVQLLSSGATTGGTDYYIAKGVGLIESKAVEGTNNSILLDYSIK